MNKSKNISNEETLEKFERFEKLSKKLKVVLLHDWLTGFRGGERVFEVFCELFPSAPIHTLIYSKGTTSPIIESPERKIHPSILNKLPNVSKYYRKLLPIFPIIAQNINIDHDTDLIISSSHCVIKGIPKPNLYCKHISYIHSPMRYIYDQFDAYFGKESGAGTIQKIVAHMIRGYLQRWDINSNNNVDTLIANSLFVQERISTFYKTNSIVINPFVDTKDFDLVKTNFSTENKENYYVMVTAFAPNKRVDLAIMAFNKLKWPLKIVGEGQLESTLQQLNTNPNTEFLGNIKRENVVNLLSKAKALIFPGVEDFGIVPLEALAAGTPVIAYKKGGVLETLNDEVALFFEEATVPSLIQALEYFENNLQKTFATTEAKNKLFARASQFSKKNFKEKIMNIILYT
ncbi:MAG: glycosyltransferase [Oligoflexia bacterium]|nr:glycosyltransferase [Oligoflexia bacterium]